LLKANINHKKENPSNRIILGMPYKITGASYEMNQCRYMPETTYKERRYTQRFVYIQRKWANGSDEERQTKSTYNGYRRLCITETAMMIAALWKERAIMDDRQKNRLTRQIFNLFQILILDITNRIG
jgi:membrane glycosyltransferase